MKRSPLNMMNLTSNRKYSSTETSINMNLQSSSGLQFTSYPQNTGRRVSTNGSISNTRDRQSGSETTTEDRSRFFGKSTTEKTYFFTGTIERVIKWHSQFKNFCCYFEVIASMISVQDGPIRLQKIILLKDRTGPILQVLHYLNHDIQLEDFSIGQTLRCIGTMAGPNVLNAVSIRRATPEEMATLKRHCYIGDFTISGLLNAG